MNIKNYDNQCFKYRKQYEHDFDYEFKIMVFPVKIDYEKFINWVNKNNKLEGDY